MAIDTRTRNAYVTFKDTNFGSIEYKNISWFDFSGANLEIYVEDGRGKPNKVYIPRENVHHFEVVWED
jgi:hypothetical protein